MKSESQWNSDSLNEAASYESAETSDTTPIDEEGPLNTRSLTSRFSTTFCNRSLQKWLMPPEVPSLTIGQNLYKSPDWILETLSGSSRRRLAQALGKTCSNKYWFHVTFRRANESGA